MQKPARTSIDPHAFDPLIAEGFIRQADLIKAFQEAMDGNTSLESLLIDKYLIPKAQVGKALSKFFDCPYVPYDDRLAVDHNLMKDLSHDYLKNHHWIPLKREDQVLDVLINNPHDLDKGGDIRRAFPGLIVRFSVSLQRDLEQFLSAAGGNRDVGSISDTLGELRNEAGSEHDGEDDADTVNENDSAIVRLTNQIIVEAYRKDASDVHIEPYSDRKETAIRFRVDGTCFTAMRVPAAYRRALVSRIKIMAHLDISERRKPQDGKLRFRLNNEKQIELRVATLPTSGGNEDVVMRVLSAKEPLPLEAMEFAPGTLTSLVELADHPYGLILCVGPTGSGKTTTLHAVLKYLNKDERKIWTAEDPIEISQDGLRQVQVHPKIGFTFASAMRSFLRADPDVIMIGEMRDIETAGVAIEASLTGHLVLSTLHTNSAVETVTRLLDMGLDPFNFADAMLGILAQRLCKRICLACKEPYRPSHEEYDELARTYGMQAWEQLGIPYNDDFRLHRGRGCDLCNQSGFKGRVALHELFRNSEDIKNMIQSRAKTSEMQRLAAKSGMTTLLQDGIHKVLAGTTTFKQIRSVAIK